MKIDYSINIEKLRLDEDTHNLANINEDWIRNHLNFGSVIFRNKDLSIEMDEINLIGFFTSFLGGIRALNSNFELASFAGIGFWDSNGENGFNISSSKDSFEIVYDKDPQLSFKVPSNEIEFQILNILVDIFSNLEKICSSYSQNESFLKLKNTFNSDRNKYAHK